MTLKTTWTTGQSFAASDQNAVAVDVNAATTKLATITSGATVNDSDANLKNRANHTGSQTSSSISDFTEAAQDAVAAMLAQGTAVTMSYNDAANTLTINSTGGGGGLDVEQVRDAIGIALVGTTTISVTVNDAADTITLSSTATVNDTNANLRDRSTHTGTQSADTIVDGTTNHVFTAADDTKLASTYTAGGTDVAVADGGTGRGTATTAYGLIAAGTTATGVQQTVSPGTSGQLLKSAGSAALPAFATVGAADLSDASTIPRVLKWSGSAWPDRPADSRVTFFIGGNTDTNAPTDGDLANGDVWIPAS